MADSVVTSLLQITSNWPLPQEADLLLKKKGPFELFHDDLKLINTFLQNSEGKRTDDEVKKLVNQIKDVAHEAEDVIDRLLVEERRTDKNVIVSNLHHAKKLPGIKTKTANINQQINKIYNEKEEYGIERKANGGDQLQRALAALHKRKRGVAKQTGNASSSWTDQTQLTDVPASNYNELPRQLKPCFLYMGAFPKDLKIPARQLIRLWIAEGFIEQFPDRNLEDKTLEDVAEDYLEELVYRGFIKVTERRADGGIKTCGIHHPQRNLCISEAAGDKFLEVFAEEGSSPSSKPRRLSIHNRTSKYISLNLPDSSCIRSFLCFEQDKILSQDEWRSLYQSLELVKVLDLGSSCLGENFDFGRGTEIEKLFLLRYLKVKAPLLTEIPPFVCNLWNLQTLDMRDSKVKCLPEEIWKMQQLRHLYVSGPTSLPNKPTGNDNTAILGNLQILSTVSPDKKTAQLIIDKVFPNVKKLGLCSHGKDGDLCALKSVLKKLNHLQTLKIMEIYKLPEIENQFPSSLTKITIVRTGLNVKNMKVLEKLPKLRVLKLIQASFKESHINFSAGGFLQLHVLQLVDLSITSLIVGEGAMKNLGRLVIHRCSKLSMIPHRLWNLTTLQEVKVLSPSSNLSTWLQTSEVKGGRNIQIDPPPSPSQ